MDFERIGFAHAERSCLVSLPIHTELETVYASSGSLQFDLFWFRCRVGTCGVWAGGLVSTWWWRWWCGQAARGGTSKFRAHSNVPRASADRVHVQAIFSHWIRVGRRALLCSTVTRACWEFPGTEVEEPEPCCAREGLEEVHAEIAVCHGSGFGVLYPPVEIHDRLIPCFFVVGAG